MKKFYILITLILSVRILSLFCLAQGSVNSNNALGEPNGQTNDPYTDTGADLTSENGLTENTVTDTVTDVTNAPDTLPANGTSASVMTDTGANAGGDGNMTAVIVVIVAALVVAAVVMIVLLTRKSRRD